MPESERRDLLRAGDRDREQVAQQLRDGYAEGRLSTDELDTRLQKAYSATTYGELHTLTADLPQRPPTPAGETELLPENARAETAMGPPWMLDAVRAWFIVSFLSFGVWIVLGLDQGFEAVHPWWIWVAGGWGGTLMIVQSVRHRKERRRLADDSAPQLGGND
ncbi:protein of unknown function (DUF1707) [Prauserella flava]|nr:protein of unknown function (DUF1707) [Prauserella flava]MCR3734413.1 protein of unknown function (DUF1707) [Prauserella salsuginis]